MGPSLGPASERKLRAKRQNERIKLLASFLNTLSLAFLGAAFVVPGVISIQSIRWIWIPLPWPYIYWRI